MFACTFPLNDSSDRPFLLLGDLDGARHTCPAARHPDPVTRARLLPARCVAAPGRRPFPRGARGPGPRLVTASGPQASRAGLDVTRQCLSQKAPVPRGDSVDGRGANAAADSSDPARAPSGPCRRGTGCRREDAASRSFAPLPPSGGPRLVSDSSHQVIRNLPSARLSQEDAANVSEQVGADGLVRRRACETVGLPGRAALRKARGEGFPPVGKRAPESQWEACVAWARPAPKIFLFLTCTQTCFGSRRGRD